MSFRRLLDRSVTWIPREVTGTDSRGNDVIADGTPVSGIPAGRDSLELSEEAGDERDQQTRRFVYFLPPEHEGTTIAPSGYDVLVDGADRFQLDGDAELVVRRRTGKTHHVEAIAYRIEG